MFNRKPKQPVQHNINKVIATITLLDQSVYVVTTKGYMLDQWIRRADVDLFHQRFSEAGGVRVTSTRWVPREQIKHIDFEIEDYFIQE